MSVTVREKLNKDKSISLYLDIYHNKKRHKEFLKECRLYKATTQVERQANKETRALADQIANKRAQELVSMGYDVVASFKNEVDFIAYFENYINHYTKKDKRNMEGACSKFKAFMKEENIKNLTVKQLSEKVVFDFAEYLKSTCEGEGASSYFARFKKMLKNAIREKVLLTNPAADVTIKREDSIVKDVLTIEEIGLLAKAPISNEQVRAAFLFSCYTGLSWIDVKELKWKHIDLRNEKLNKVRAKSGQMASVNLHKTAISLLPNPGNTQEYVFTLPSHTGALKLLRNWLKAAKIEKHITWHCARHSFASNLIYYKGDISTISKLMGHSTIKYTQRYTRIADEMKKKTIDNLPEIIL